MVSKWWRPASIPTRPFRPDFYWEGLSVFETEPSLFEIPDLDNWWMPASESPRTDEPVERGLGVSILEVTVLPDIFPLQSWNRPTEIPPSTHLYPACVWWTSIVEPDVPVDPVAKGPPYDVNIICQTTWNHRLEGFIIDVGRFVCEDTLKYDTGDSTP
jgi:hypothetical protein